MKHIALFNNINSYNDNKDNLNSLNISYIKNNNRTCFSNYEYVLDHLRSNSSLYANCEFFYENSNKEILTNYKSMTYNEVISFNEYNIAPRLAKYIGIYQNNAKIKDLSIDHFAKQFNNLKYSVGLTSDIHYKDSTTDADITTYSSDGTEYETDFPNALTFYQNNEDIEFICSAGDITSNSILHLMNCKKVFDTYAPTTPFYSCLGNHDIYSITHTVPSNNIGYDITNKTADQLWNDILAPSNSKYEIHYENSNSEYGKASYWFEVPIEGTNKSDIYIFLSINYDNNSTTTSKLLTTNDPYMQDIIDYVGYMPSAYNLQFYDNATLIWFKNLLEQFKHKRCFIFTHQFFIHKSGSNNGDNTNYFQYGGRTDSTRRNSTSSYCLVGIQFEFLNKLNNEYKNTIWFTGHSHYKWNWQTIDQHININDNEYEVYRPDTNADSSLNYLRTSNNVIAKTGFNVHLPSLIRPLKISSTYLSGDQESEGGVMDVYENYVDIRGIVFKESDSNEYINKYYPLAYYRIPIKAN